MEIIKINQSKLKIMLNENDLAQYHISPEEMDYADSTTRHAIRHILQDISVQTGFEIDGVGILVQVFASRGGGCELFVTRDSEKENTYAFTEDDDVCALCHSEGGRSEYRLPALRENIAYTFDSLETLLCVCRLLSKCGHYEESSAYRDHNGSFYLMLCGVGRGAYSRLDKLSFISEYGERVDPDSFISYIGEYGIPICSENAVKILGSL